MTAAQPIRLGPLGGESAVVHRSGIHWLCDDGHLCRPNEIIAYFNIGVATTALLGIGSKPFADERVLQVAIAPRVAGRLRIAAGISAGGYLDVMGVQIWDPNEVVAYIETVTVEDQDTGMSGSTARLLVLAGRRMSWAVDVDWGLLPGWHARARAWWDDGTNDQGDTTLLSLGICDASGIVRGDRSGFVEMFEATPFPAQIIHASEHPIALCAPVLLEQLQRTPSQVEAISADMNRSLGQGQVTPEDWIYFGTLTSQLCHSPIRETYDVLTSRGLEKRKPANAILLSSSAESLSILRHRKLGYHLNILAHNAQSAGPMARAWLASAFEPVTRTLDDIRRDYVRLFEAVGAATGARSLVLNRMSTSGREDISSYAPFDAPMGQTLSSVAAKEMNLMLEELAAAFDVSVVDIDAIASDIGGREHLPDGVHQSGLMQSLSRAEILRILAQDANRQQNRSRVRY